MANGIKIPPSLAYGIIILLSLMVAVNFFATFIVDSWRPDPAIYGLATTLIGTITMLSRAGKDGKSTSEGGSPDA